MSVRTDAAADAAAPDARRSAELADDDGRRGGAFVATALDAMAGMLADAEDELGRIDAVAGDGDHGRGMVKGSSAARDAAAAAAEDGAGQGSVLAAAGKEWAAKAGGTSGVLWGALLTAVGARLGDTGAPDSATVAAAMRDGYDALIQLGGASPGDKTMLDALLPFVEELRAPGGRRRAVAGRLARRRRRRHRRGPRDRGHAAEGRPGPTARRTQRRHPRRGRHVAGDVRPHRRGVLRTDIRRETT